MTDAKRECRLACRSACEGPADFQVTYRRQKTRELIEVEEPYCFKHALEHVDRAAAASSMAIVEFERIPKES